jgi:serine/threonine-protein kinase
LTPIMGATLYTLIAGRPPFIGTGALEVIEKVANEEPEPLPVRIPADLRIIVSKCLEKSPESRYESARALSEDLQRFLDGEPILARPVGVLRKLARIVRKHPVAAATLATAVIGLATLLMVVRWSQRRANEQANIARDFGQEVERIEAAVRYQNLLPRHDVRDGRAKVRERMRAIESRIDTLGALAEGPGGWALGRAHLAFHEYAAARAAFERAWNTGYHESTVAAGLGRAYGELYRTELAATALIAGKKARQARRAEIERDLRDLALHWLELGRQADDDTGMTDALAAFYRNENDNAVARARIALQRTPWLYEAAQLEGSIRFSEGLASYERGDNDAARAKWEQAGEAIMRARSIAGSDPSLYDDECQRRSNVVFAQIEARSITMDSFSEAQAECDSALLVDPDHVVPYVQKARQYWYVANQEASRGKDPTEGAQQAIRLAESALRIEPLQPVALEVISNSYGDIADYQAAHGGDPRSALGHGIEAAEKVLSVHKDAVPYNSLAALWESRVDYEAGHGIDPSQSIARTRGYLHQAIDLNPKYHQAYNNLGILENNAASWELRNGRDPRSHVAQAVTAFSKALEINPSMSSTDTNLAAALSYQASYELAAGVDPHTTVDRAVDACKRSLAKDPSLFAAWDNLAGVLATDADYQLRHGRDASAVLVEARASASKALALDPTNFFAELKLAELSLLEARWGHRDFAMRNDALEQARAHASRSFALDETCVDCAIALGTVERWAATFESGAAKRRDLALKGLDHVERALKLDATRPSALALKAALRMLSGDSAGRTELDATLRLDALLEHDYDDLRLDPASASPR